MNKRHIPFIATILAIVLFLLGTIYYHESILKNGEVVILETVPIDPRDLFRGEYVVLRYAIENDELIQAMRTELENVDTAYLRLERNIQGIASVAEVQLEEPDWSSGLWLKAVVNNGQVRFPMLEQYYVPEGAGLPIERLGSDIYVAVVLHNSEARIQSLLDRDLSVIDPRDYIER